VHHATGREKFTKSGRATSWSFNLCFYKDSVYAKAKGCAGRVYITSGQQVFLESLPSYFDQRNQMKKLDLDKKEIKNGLNFRVERESFLSHDLADKRLETAEKLLVWASL
jgi:hypothetical protein